MNERTIAICSGEPAGVGPDLCLALGRRQFDAKLLILADRELIAERARRLSVELPTNVEIKHVPLAGACTPGQLNPLNAPYTLALLDDAMDGCREKRYAAMVTAPVHKGVINDAGIHFTGHTEYLAERANANVVMMLVGGGLRVALASTHLALRDVALSLRPENLRTTLLVLHQDLQSRFGLAKPRILVCGLNPHAGEGGYLGREEIEFITPVVEDLRSQGMDVRGPLPADTVFTPRVLAQGDCVLAMYHDQGLPVLKYASFGEGVNVTLGLPFIRTSVDHGTALDLAGTGKADPGSLFEAVDLAIAMSKQEAGPH
ncbi:MAG TPA: 4-hydroxythreonine-4-phosphate dehydrogenase PdxA [Burkholderiales bacterium]|nr:4-hydroxythreonine-4-phosphate dehydrogenase PdxA [Burkholderiales bacterium]